jgi:ketosteroid isomerase-like protein
MSANLDLVRSIYAAWERGDFRSAEWAHPEIEFASPMGVETGTWTGRAEMSQAWRSTMSAWDDVHIAADEYVELDGERILALHRFSGRGKASGIQLGPRLTKGAVLFHVRSGKVVRLVIYMDRERALADLGVAE